MVLDNPFVIGYSLVMRGYIKVGQSIQVPKWKEIPNNLCYGTITRVTKNKVRILFPIRKFVWLDKSEVKVIRP